MVCSIRVRKGSTYHMTDSMTTFNITQWYVPSEVRPDNIHSGLSSPSLSITHTSPSTLHFPFRTSSLNFVFYGLKIQRSSWGEHWERWRDFTASLGGPSPRPAPSSLWHWGPARDARCRCLLCRGLWEQSTPCQSLFMNWTGDGNRPTYSLILIRYINAFTEKVQYIM